MNCRRCGSILPNGVIVCPNCGENNKSIDINQGNLSVNDLMNIKNQDNGVRLDFVNDDQNIGNSALNNYNNDQNFQYDKRMFDTGKRRARIRINPKYVMILGIIVFFIFGMYLIFGDEFKKMDEDPIIDPSTGKAIDPDDPSTDPTDPSYYHPVDDDDDDEDDDDEDDDDDDDDDDDEDDDDPYGGNGGSGGGGGSGGESGYDDEEDDGSTKTVEFLNVEFEIPYRSTYYVMDKADMFFVASGKKYAVFTFAQGVIETFIVDTNDVVNKMQKKVIADYREHESTTDYRFSYEGEKQIGKYLFYIFGTGKQSEKVFFLKYNDHYYIEGLVQVEGNTNIDMVLKFVRDIIKTAKNSEDMDEVEEDYYEYTPHISYFDLIEYKRAIENRPEEEE